MHVMKFQASSDLAYFGLGINMLNSVLIGVTDPHVLSITHGGGYLRKLLKIKLTLNFFTVSALMRQREDASALRRARIWQGRFLSADGMICNSDGRMLTRLDFISFYCFLKVTNEL